MNYIVDYEKLPLSFPEVPLQRWGGIHKEISSATNSNQTDEYDIVNNVNEKDKAIRDIINKILAEYDNTIVSHQTSASQIIIVDESNTLHTNVDEELVDLTSNTILDDEKEDIQMYWDTVERFIPLLMDSGFKTDFINDIKLIYNECSLMEPISRSIIDLTQYDDNDDEKDNDLNIVTSSKKSLQKKKKRKLFY
jgi:hypothetical protein